MYATQNVPKSELRVGVGVTFGLGLLSLMLLIGLT